MSLARITLSQSATRPGLDFVLPGLISGSVGMIVGAGAIGKSFLALETGIGIASGRPIAGGLWHPSARGNVTIIMGEDDCGILQERLYWLRQAEGINDEEAADIDERLTIFSGRGVDMRIVEATRAGVESGPFLPELTRICADQRLVIVDPLLFLNGGDENDNGCAAVFMSTLYGITAATGATIILLHHAGKGSLMGKEEWELSRGASALTTSVRWQLNMVAATKSISPPGVPEEELGQWVRVALAKSNYGARPEPAWLKRGKGGVLTLEEPGQSVMANAAEYREATGKGGRKHAKSW